MEGDKMTKRKENIRKACDEIKEYARIAQASLNNIDNIRAVGMIANAQICLDRIIPLIHRIKRTTWRGNEGKYIVKKSKSKIRVDKDIAKRINTNTTTTANIDVSTIPYY